MASVTMSEDEVLHVPGSSQQYSSPTEIPSGPDFEMTDVGESQQTDPMSVKGRPQSE